MSVNEPLSYEASVYAEDVTAIANAIVREIHDRVGPIGGEKMKACIAAAAMMSAAQALDGDTFKDLGVTGALARMVATYALTARR